MLTTEKTNTAVQPLNPAELPLQGRHLIEASAGTGKTFNITRLYLRLLLEKKLSVQQILLMTFTKAATEELRGRIDKELRQALAQWGSLGSKDPFFAIMEQRFTAEQAQTILQPALLELDEASIFTIHGFCKRVLSQQAFASGLPLEVSMEADTSDLRLQAVRDSLRQLAVQPERYALLTEQGWHQPDVFFDKFATAIASANPLRADNSDSLKDYYQQQGRNKISRSFSAQQHACLTSLNAQKSLLWKQLIDGKKDATKRIDEWECMLAWLSQPLVESSPKALKSFINGNRYRGNEQIKSVFEPVKKLCDGVNKAIKNLDSRYQQDCDKQPLYQIAVAVISDIRLRLKQAKAAQAVLDFDDLILQLSQAVTASPSLVSGLRQQYPAALVDEFQDTDQQQYQILDGLYPVADPKLLLLMIGDPKQAIYGFRGGDIFTYLKARDQADYRWHMDTNWRSTQDVVTGYNRLFWGAPLDEAAKDVFSYQISYEQIKHTVHAAAADQALVDLQDRKALSYLWLAEPENVTGKGGKPTKADYQAGLASACAKEICRLLQQATLAEQALEERDIAVLVRSGSEAKFIQDALQQLNLSSVYLSSKDKLFASEEAAELLQVLQGVWHCEQTPLAMAALASRLLGGDAAHLARLRDVNNEHEWEQAKDNLYHLRQLWLSKGVMALILQLLHHHYRPSPQRHERALTNLLHLAELLQNSAKQYAQPQQLLAWFIEQQHNPSYSEEALQRLESDANLIRIVTQHGSKGLEYPIVFIPFATVHSDPARRGSQYLDFYRYHEPKTEHLIEQVGRSEQALDCLRAEGYAESLRLLYVAVTRASHRCYLGVAPFDASEQSPLGLALGLGSSSSWPQSLAALQASSHGSSECLAVTRIGSESLSEDHSSGSALLHLSQLKHRINAHWRLSSFSSLVKQAKQVRQDQKEHGDLSEDAPSPSSDDSHLALRFSLKKGAAAGNLLHDILEHCDFSQPQWAQLFITPVQHFGEIEPEQLEQLQEWLDEVLAAPLPSIGLANSFSLAQLSMAKTLRESEFYFPLENASMKDLAACLRQHRQTQQPLGLPEFSRLQGMMHGFIDLICEYEQRYYIVDYKSTHLGNHLDDYSYTRLQANNQQHFYDLQYLIYSLALHRYLRTRLSNYDPQQHFGGVYYLYLRGMSKSDSLGVYHCDISPALLQQLDSVFSEDSAK